MRCARVFNIMCPRYAVLLTTTSCCERHSLMHALCCWLLQVECDEIFDPTDDDKVKVTALHKFGGVALLRVRANHMKQFGANDKFVMIVRTDLMRWALSNYFKQNYAIQGRHHDPSPLNDTLIYKDPQFTPNVSLPVRKINLMLLVRILRLPFFFFVFANSSRLPRRIVTRSALSKPGI